MRVYVFMWLEDGDSVWMFVGIVEWEKPLSGDPTGGGAGGDLFSVSMFSMCVYSYSVCVFVWWFVCVYVCYSRVIENPCHEIQPEERKGRLVLVSVVFLFSMCVYVCLWKGDSVCVCVHMCGYATYRNLACVFYVCTIYQDITRTLFQPF